MYSTIEAWRDYATARGNTAPASASDTDATAALVRASDYIRTRYVLRIGGLTADSENVIEATHIAAGYELETPGFWSRTFTPGEAKVLTKVDTIEWTPVSVKSGVGSDVMLPVSPAIDALLLSTGAYNVPPMFAI